MDDHRSDPHRDRSTAEPKPADAGRAKAGGQTPQPPPAAGPVPFGSHELPAAGRSIRIGDLTVKGMEVYEGPAFYQLS